MRPSVRRQVWLLFPHSHCETSSAEVAATSTSTAHRRIETDGDSYELAVGSNWEPFIERMLTGTTRADRVVDELDIPLRPLWLRWVIRILRWYRANISPRLGQRCVFEPSCSRYAELAIRQRGLFVGTVFTIRRLVRCRGGKGGVDFP